MAKETMRIVIAGHVDHGKSTLIGRLFYDTNSIPEERLERIKRKSKQQGKEIEFAYLMDALEEEQDQGITIDTTQTFFKTKKRDYVIIDAPGHKEFLKNMITGASNAEAAILIVDAVEGVREQTKRHAYIIHMLGIRQIIVAVNKMDALGFDQSKFEGLKIEITDFLQTLGLNPTHITPISAKDGDNIANRSEKTDWFHGVTVLEGLDSFSKMRDLSNLPLRFPVQDVYKFDDKRRIVGRIESGTLKEGDTLTFWPSSKSTKVKSVEKWKRPLKEAAAGQSIGITMGEEIFVKRGEIASLNSTPPKTTKSFKANLFWMGKTPLKIKKKYTLKLATEEIDCLVSKVHRRIDSSTLATIQENASEVQNTEVGEITLTAKNPVAFDLFTDIPTTGRFVLVDGNQVAGGGIITEAVYHADKVIREDFRGQRCPMTLEYAKPLIEKIKKGQVVEIIIDFMPAIETIGRFAFEHNLEFHFKREKDYIILTVKSP